MPADVVKSGLQQPSMWITSEADTWRLQRWSDRDVMQHQSMRAVFKSLPGDGYFVQVPRMFHLNLTDVPLLNLFTVRQETGLVRADRCPSSTSHRQRLHPGVLRPSSQGHAGNAARWTSSTVPRSPHRLAPPLIHFPIRTVLVNNAQLPSPQPPCKPVIAEQEVWAADHLAGVRTS
jgi:hypothetical protein